MSDLVRFGEQIKRILPPPVIKVEKAKGAKASIALEKKPAARSYLFERSNAGT
jgi:hypothetical protein